MSTKKLFKIAGADTTTSIFQLNLGQSVPSQFRSALVPEEIRRQMAQEQCKSMYVTWEKIPVSYANSGRKGNMTDFFIHFANV